MFVKLMMLSFLGSENSRVPKVWGVYSKVRGEGFEPSNSYETGS
jgi:hypothetical protein